jgi:hypothetical protein
MPVRLNGSTSGYTELSAPPVAGNNTITLPATSGTAVVNGANSAIVSGTAVASTSGTSIDFTGIPSWVKRVTVMFNGVSTSAPGTNNIQVQLGAGSITTSGYVGGASTVSVLTNNSTGLVVSNTVAATDTLYGAIILTNIAGNNWVSSHTAVASGVRAYWGAGQVALSGTLDRIRIIGSATGAPSDTFDAGSINILYE